MVFITGAPPASLGTWIVPVCVAHAPSGAPGSLELSVWSALPRTKTRQTYYEKINYRPISCIHRENKYFQKLFTKWNLMTCKKDNTVITKWSLSWERKVGSKTNPCDSSY